MSFRITNAQASFQTNIDDGLQPCVNHFAISCQDNLQIYSTNKMDQVNYIQYALEQLHQFVLNCFR